MGPEFQRTVGNMEKVFEEASKPKSSGCQKPANKRNSNSTKICVPLKRFSAEQVQINMNKSGLITITASTEKVDESVRNGQRKTTVVVEETCQLPGYLMESGLLEKVEEEKNAPIEIPIMMEN